MAAMKKAVVAGSLGLDIIPVFPETATGSTAQLFAQGKFNDMRGTRLYLGGCVGNTGIAMYKLGVDVMLTSKVGQDLLGSCIRMILDQQNVPISIEEVPDINSTSTVVIAPFSGDRVLLHSRGASQTFVSTDLELDTLSKADLLHFGYPTAMKYLYANDGEEFIKLVQRAKTTGITVAVDTSQPDPTSEAGQVNWRNVLQAALPSIDVFMPSLEELLFMLHKPVFEELDAKRNGGNMMDYIDFEMIPRLADELLGMGARIVLIKIGKKGLYLRTGSREVLSGMGRALPENWECWADRELIHLPYYTDSIRSTTGAGDNAIAGFLAALLRSDEPEHALSIASMNALRCIESYETTADVLPIDQLDEIVAARPAMETAAGIPLEYWTEEPEARVFLGKRDAKKA